ncbi:MAG: HAMP domain-containing histidine kinase, partial [Alphaproteobacteria bacterium]|nr:HAMP domain-containing histidine kinase [Alphaproteobacteria bacterium]
TGLGLPISLRLMEMHGGTVSISSVLGKGTMATLFFPKERVRPDTGNR